MAAFDRLMTTIRPHVPGAVDQGIKQELFFVCQQFFKRSEVWQETFEVDLPPGENTVTITPVAGRVERLMGVTSGGQPVRGAVMPEPGVVLIPRSSSASQTYIIVVVITVTDPIEADAFPIAPEELVTRYTEELMHGTLSRMFVQPSKPYTNLPLAQFYETKFTAGIARARNDARTFYLAGAQRWSYPIAGTGTCVTGGIGGGQGPEGPSGPQGEPGPQGPIGPQGPQGSIGPAGPAGTVGASAYQVAVANGFMGDEAEWLESLVGADGADGPQGPIGPQGPQGPIGPQGPAGVVDWAQLIPQLEIAFATLPTSPPVGSGKAWNNGGTLVFTP